MEEWQIQLVKDHKLLKILDKNFDEEEYVLNLLNQTTTAELSEVFTKLTSIKQNITQSFSQTINNNYNRLIDDFQNLKDLNFEITDCKIRMQSIHKVIGNVNHNLMQNFDNIQNKAPILKNTREALLTSRRALKFLQSLKKLKSVVGPKNEILDVNKACLILKEIIKIVSEKGLDGIAFYEKEKDFLNQIREQIIEINDKKFQKSIASRNTVEVTHCVQNFYNLRILTDRTQNAATNIMKTINEEWKKFLYQEYEKPPNGMVVMSNSLKILLQEQLNYHMQLWILSTILRKRDSNSLDSFFEYMKKGKLVNLYDMVWERQTKLISHHLDKFREEKPENIPKAPLINNNRLLLIRIYPKMFYLFNDFLENLNLFMLKNPDPHEIKSIMELRDSFLEPLKPFSDMYYKHIESEISQRFKFIGDSIFQNDSSSFRVFIGANISELNRLIQFTNFEIRDNIKNESIFKAFSKTFLSVVSENVTNIYRRYEQAEPSTLSLNRIFMLYIFLYEVRKTVMSVINQKYNDEVDTQKVDDFYTFSETCESHLLEVIFQTLFEYCYKIVEDLHKSYQRDMAQRSPAEGDLLKRMAEFLSNYSVTSNKGLETSIAFIEQWNRLLYSIVYLLGVVFSYASEKEPKILEMINSDIEKMGSIIDSINKKDTSQRLFLINIQKLLLIDPESMKYFIENKHELLQNIPLSLVLLNFLKRLEREANVSLSNLLEKEKEKTLSQILSLYFRKDVSLSLLDIKNTFDDPSEIKKCAETYILNASNKTSYNLKDSVCFQVVELLINMSC